MKISMQICAKPNTSPVYPPMWDFAIKSTRYNPNAVHAKRLMISNKGKRGRHKSISTITMADVLHRASADRVPASCPRPLDFAGGKK